MSDKYTNPDFAEYTAEQQFREEVAEHLAVTPPDSGRRGPREIDNAYREDSQPVRRFYMRRMKDETGISRTGRVLEGIVTQSGRVIVEWRPPHSTLGIYRDMAEFQTIHVDCHPSCNEVVWLDAALAASAPAAPPEDFQGYCDRCGARGVMVTDVGSEDLCVNCRAVAAAPPEPAIYCPRCNLSSADVETLLREAAAPPAGGTREAEARLWSLIGRVLSQGAAIQMDYAAGKYAGIEDYYRRIDDAARERLPEFVALCAALAERGAGTDTQPSQGAGQ